MGRVPDEKVQNERVDRIWGKKCKDLQFLCHAFFCFGVQWLEEVRTRLVCHRFRLAPACALFQQMFCEGSETVTFCWGYAVRCSLQFHHVPWPKTFARVQCSAMNSLSI